MRISTSLMFRTGLDTINLQQSQLLHLYQQIGTGRRMVTPADDPLAASQAVNLAQTEALNTRFAANREVAKLNLNTEENVLNTITLSLQDIKTRLVEAGNGSYSDADRATLANVLRHSFELLVNQANATDGNGQYLFSGLTGNMPAYVTSLDVNDNPVVTWNGTDGQRNIQVDQTRQIASGDVGLDIFQRANPGSNAHIGAADADNAGTGRLGTPAITDVGGPNVKNSFSISFAGNPLEYTVEVTNPAGAPVQTQGPYAYVEGAPFDMGGVQVSISGTPVAGDTFTIEPAQSTDMDIFATLSAIITALEQPVEGDPVAGAALGNLLTTTMQKLDVNYDNVLTVRASVGARLNEIEALDGNGSLRDLSYKKQLSNLEDVDYYSATAMLTLRQAALEAAALAFRKIQSTSLFNQQ